MREPRYFRLVFVPGYRDKCFRYNNNPSKIKNMLNQPVKNEPKKLIVAVLYVKLIRLISNYVKIEFNDLRNLS